MVTTHGWSPKPLGELTDPPVPEIAGLFVPGLVHELQGPTEAGKTMLLLCAAIDEIRAGHVVLWIDREMGKYTMRHRLDALGVSQAWVDKFVDRPRTRRFYYINPDETASSEVLDELLALRPRLVVVDSMTAIVSLYGLSSNSDTDIEYVHTHISFPLKEGGAAVVWIDHPGKDERRGTAGSIRKENAVDIRYTVQGSGYGRTTGGGTSTLYIAKDRESLLGDRRVARQFQLEGTHWTFDVAPSPLDVIIELTKPADAAMREKIIEFVRMHENDPPTKRAVAKGIQGNNRRKYACIAQLIEEGVLVEERRAGSDVLVLRLRRPVPEPVPGGSRTGAGTPVPSGSPPYRGTGGPEPVLGNHFNGDEAGTGNGHVPASVSARLTQGVRSNGSGEVSPLDLTQGEGE